MAKIGRNDPCSCGSGKKYKRCCGFSQPQLTLADQSDMAEVGVAEPSGAPLFDRRLFERTVSDITRMLGDREFNSEEEMNAAIMEMNLDQIHHSMAPRTPMDEAQDLMYDAWEASGGERNDSSTRSRP